MGVRGEEEQMSVSNTSSVMSVSVLGYIESLKKCLEQSADARDFLREKKSSIFENLFKLYNSLSREEQLKIAEFIDYIGNNFPVYLNSFCFAIDGKTYHSILYALKCDLPLKFIDGMITRNNLTITRDNRNDHNILCNLLIDREQYPNTKSSIIEKILFVISKMDSDDVNLTLIQYLTYMIQHNPDYERSINLDFLFQMNFYRRRVSVLLNNGFINLTIGRHIWEMYMRHELSNGDTVLIPGNMLHWLPLKILQHVKDEFKISYNDYITLFEIPSRHFEKYAKMRSFIDRVYFESAYRHMVDCGPLNIPSVYAQDYLRYVEKHHPSAVPSIMASPKNDAGESH